MANRFFQAVLELADQTSDSPSPIGEMGGGLAHTAETQRHVEALAQEAMRPLGELVILPLSLRLESEKRHVTRLEKDYEKHLKVFAHVSWSVTHTV